jgi:hypothetical protein
MSRGTEGRNGLWSRRLLLQMTMGSAGTAVVIAARPDPASAAPKISQAAVAYQDHPQDDKRCGKCLQFQAPDSCKMVDGAISPQGFCRIFVPIRQAGRPMSDVRATG